MTEKIKYIENLIAETKDGIRHWEAQLEEDKTEFDKSITRGYIQIREKKLKLLESIKKDLEALEVIKDKIEFEDLGEMPSGNIYRGYFNDCLDEEEYNKFMKSKEAN